MCTDISMFLSSARALTYWISRVMNRGAFTPNWFCGVTFTWKEPGALGVPFIVAKPVL
jgi:hypothetical protein